MSATLKTAADLTGEDATGSVNALDALIIENVARFTLEEAIVRRDALNAAVSIEEL